MFDLKLLAPEKFTILTKTDESYMKTALMLSNLGYNTVERLWEYESRGDSVAIFVGNCRDLTCINQNELDNTDTKFAVFDNIDSFMSYCFERLYQEYKSVLKNHTRWSTLHPNHSFDSNMYNELLEKLEG